MANYLDENGLRTLVDRIKDNFVPYTGATKNIDLGVRSVTANNIVANGTTKLVGGIAPLHTIRFSDASEIYTIDILYEKTDDNAGGYNFIGIYNDAYDRNWIVNGHYSKNTTNQKTYIRFVVFDGEENKCSVHFFTVDKDNIAQENYIKYLTDEDDLKTIGEKLNDDSVIYNNGLTVTSTGDVIAAENLIVKNRVQFQNGVTPKSSYSSTGFTIGIIWEWAVQNSDAYRTFVGVRLLSGVTTGSFIYGWYKPSSSVVNNYCFVCLDEFTSKFVVSAMGTDPWGKPAKGGTVAFQQDVDANTTEISALQAATGSDWEFLGKVAEKTFSKAFTEVKPGSSGIPSGNATVNVTATTYQKKVEGAIVGYKTIVDITCRCEQFNLNDVGFNVLLSKAGSRWFVPRMAIAKGNMASTAFNTMMDKLNAQKDDVGISVDEVAVFKDNRGVSGNPGTLNVSGVTNGQVVYDAAEFRVFAVMLELDKDNEGKAIPCTGAHYKISIFHPQTIL